MITKKSTIKKIWIRRGLEDPNFDRLYTAAFILFYSYYTNKNKFEKIIKPNRATPHLTSRCAREITCKFL